MAESARAGARGRGTPRRARARAGAPAPEGVLPHRGDSGLGGTCTNLGLSSGVPVPRVPLHSLPTAPRVRESSRPVRLAADSTSRCVDKIVKVVVVTLSSGLLLC